MPGLALLHTNRRCKEHDCAGARGFRQLVQRRIRSKFKLIYGPAEPMTFACR